MAAENCFFLYQKVAGDESLFAQLLLKDLGAQTSQSFLLNLPEYHQMYIFYSV